MSDDQIVAEALLSPVEQRALVAEFHWESLEDPFAASLQMTMRRRRRLPLSEIDRWTQARSPRFGTMR